MPIKDPYRYFRIEARELMEKINQTLPQLGSPDADARAAAATRLGYLLHTLKGAASVSGHIGIAAQGMEFEGFLAPLLDGAATVNDDQRQEMLRLHAALTASVTALEPAP